MIQKSSIIKTSNVSGIVTVNCFHIYQKKKNYIASFGNFIKVSTRFVFFREKKFRKKKFKAILILLKYRYTKPDNSYLFFFKNTCILLKRRVISLTDFVDGCCIYNLKRKKFLLSFVNVI